jgi:hypothetical protein
MSTPSESGRYEPAGYEPGSNQQQRPLSELLSDMTQQITTLFRQEVELAKVEVRQEVSEAGKAAGILVGGGVAAFVALLILAMAASWGLAAVMPAGWAFLIVALVIAVIAGVLVVVGRNRLREVSPKPEQTIETVKEDVQWLKNQRS